MRVEHTRDAPPEDGDYLWLKNTGQWDQVNIKVEVFSDQLMQYQFLRACDLGLTGIIFEAYGFTFAILDNWNHVTDCRGLIRGGRIGMERTLGNLNEAINKIREAV